MTVCFCGHSKLYSSYDSIKAKCLEIVRGLIEEGADSFLKIPHLHSVHNGSRIRHLHERGDADGTAQENRIEAENSVG